MTFFSRVVRTDGQQTAWGRKNFTIVHLTQQPFGGQNEEP